MKEYGVGRSSKKIDITNSYKRQEVVESHDSIWHAGTQNIKEEPILHFYKSVH